MNLALNRTPWYVDFDCLFVYSFVLFVWNLNPYVVCLIICFVCLRPSPIYAELDCKSFPKTIKHISRNATTQHRFTFLGLQLGHRVLLRRWVWFWGLLVWQLLRPKGSRLFSYSNLWYLMVQKVFSISSGTFLVFYAIFKVNEYDGCPGVCGPNCNYETEDWWVFVGNYFYWLYDNWST